MGDGADHATGQKRSVLIGVDEVQLLRLRHLRGHVVGVYVAALVQQPGDDPFNPDVFQEREERRVRGHETHRRLGALTDAGERIGGGVDGVGLGSSQPQAHRSDQFGKQRFLGGEVPVEQPLGHTGGTADVHHSGCAVAALGEESLGGVEQLLFALPALIGELSVGGVHFDQSSSPLTRRSIAALLPRWQDGPHPDQRTVMQLIPGADPWSHHGTTTAGALCLHGFTGNPGAMRGVAAAFAGVGFHIELPRLPGHGTTVEDMMTTGWSDWTAEVESAFARLSERCDKVVVAGLSMGGSLSVYLATKHPDIVGLALVNPLVQPAENELVEMARGALDEGMLSIPGIGSDIADPDSTENSYNDTPIGPFISLTAGLHAMQSDIGSITMPVLIMTSTQDHVVDPTNSDFLAATVSGPVERVTLERSYHVATLDYDRDVIFEHVVAFGQKVCA